MRRPILIAAAALLLVASPVGAEEKPWEADLRPSYVILGSDRPTGGPALWGEGKRRWTLSDTVTATGGAQFGVVGVGGPGNWLGVLGGPVGSVSVRPWTPDVRLTLGLALDFGRLPTCKHIAGLAEGETLCLGYVGLFPALSGGVDFYSEGHVAAGASCSLRYINTLGWTGASVEPSAFARVFW